MKQVAIEVAAQPSSADGAGHSGRQGARRPHAIPQYLSGSYAWAYLNRRNARLLDHNVVVNAILLGNHGRLRRAALSEIVPGQRVLQVAHVYGCLIPEMACRIGQSGRLDVIDLVPLQAALCRLKLRGCRQARVRVADARALEHETYDVVNCFFLLHEVPDQDKRIIVDSLLRRVAPGGKAVFLDYHAPAHGHPLRAFYQRIFDLLEPYAKAMWDHEVQDFATHPDAFRWQKVTMFGGVFQKTVAYHEQTELSA